MRASLIDSSPEKYLSTTKDGRTVENWHAINHDSKRLEKICRGKVPESSDLLHLLSEDVNLDTENSEPARTSISVRNPYKRLWQERGVRWPSPTSTPASSSISSLCCLSQQHPTCRYKSHHGGQTRATTLRYVALACCNRLAGA